MNTSEKSLDIQKRLEKDEKQYMLWDVDEKIMNQINAEKEKEFADIKKHLMEEFELYKFWIIKAAEHIATQDALKQADEDAKWI